MSSENKKRLAPTAIRASLIKETRVAASTFTTIKNITNFIIRQLDKIIFALMLIALILAAVMCLTIKDIQREIDTLDKDIEDIKAKQTELVSMANTQTYRIDKLLSEGNVLNTEVYYPEYLRNVPLSLEMQKFTYDTCEEYGVDYDMVLAIMKVESQFSNIISDDGNDYGICQINKINHAWLAEEHDLTDMLDEKQNITACVLILADIQEEFTAPNEILMAYNLGKGGARDNLSEGVTSTYYVEKVMEVMNNET